jgi:hypothetical protein
MQSPFFSQEVVYVLCDKINVTRFNTHMHKLALGEWRNFRRERDHFQEWRLILTSFDRGKEEPRHNASLTLTHAGNIIRISIFNTFELHPPYPHQGILWDIFWGTVHSTVSRIYRKRLVLLLMQLSQIKVCRLTGLNTQALSFIYRPQNFFTRIAVSKDKNTDRGSSELTVNSFHISSWIFSLCIAEIFHRFIMNIEAVKVLMDEGAWVCFSGCCRVRLLFCKHDKGL